jgi:hypothetical protein
MCYEDGRTNAGEERPAEAWRIHDLFPSLIAEELELSAPKYLKRPDERDNIQFMIASAFARRFLRLSPPFFPAPMNAAVDATNNNLGLTVSEAEKSNDPSVLAKAKSSIYLMATPPLLSRY